MSKRSLDKRVGTRSGVYYNRTIRRVRRTRKYQEEGIGVKAELAFLRLVECIEKGDFDFSKVKKIKTFLQ